MRILTIATEILFGHINFDRWFGLETAFLHPVPDPAALFYFLFLFYFIIIIDQFIIIIIIFIIITIIMLEE